MSAGLATDRRLGQTDSFRSRTMTFFWPEVLWLLFALPALVAGYVFLLTRRKLATLRVSNLAMIREAVGPPNYRRHIPPVILLASIAALIVAIARPAAVVSLPGLEETVILAIDVSASMRATDVEPSRIDAAQHAAKAFVAAMPNTVRIGIVSFAGSAAVVQGPTLDHQEIEDAIDRLSLGPSTNLYGGIALSLAAMFPQDGVELEHFTDARTSSRFPDKPHPSGHGQGPSSPEAIGPAPSSCSATVSERWAGIPSMPHRWRPLAASRSTRWDSERPRGRSSASAAGAYE